MSKKPARYLGYNLLFFQSDSLDVDTRASVITFVFHFFRDLSLQTYRSVYVYVPDGSSDKTSARFRTGRSTAYSRVALIYTRPLRETLVYTRAVHRTTFASMFYLGLFFFIHCIVALAAELIPMPACFTTGRTCSLFPLLYIYSSYPFVSIFCTNHSSSFG